MLVQETNSWVVDNYITMNRTLLFLLIITSFSLFAYSDSDMDGVDDTLDQCPNTSFNELVDIKGCSTTSLLSPHHFDIIFGVENSQVHYATLEKSDTFTQNIQLDYYYKNFSLQASTSYYNAKSKRSTDAGLNDSFLGAYYNVKPTNKLTVRIGVGIVIPTYNDAFNTNNTDYTASLNCSYILQDINLFAGYGYTIITDEDIQNSLSYQDTNTFTAGLGLYPSKNLYISASYSSSESIYLGVDKIKKASLYAFYNLNKNWFTNVTYSYGLSDTASDNTISLRLGYYF